MHVNAIARNGAGCEPYSDSNVKEQSYVYIVYMIRWLPVFCLRAASTRTVNTIPFRLHSMRVRFVFVSFLFHVVDRILSYSRHFDHFYKKKKSTTTQFMHVYKNKTKMMNISLVFISLQY